MLSFRGFINKHSASRFAGIFPTERKTLNEQKFIGCSSDFAFKNQSDFPEFDHRWHFGIISYEYKNVVEKLTTGKPGEINWPQAEFWSTERVEELYADSSDTEITWPTPQIHCSHTKQEYERCFQALQYHIQQGDIYETNFCIRFEAENVELDPAVLFQRLYVRLQAPYATFYKSGERFLLCMSPELYLRKEGIKLYSEPMKGTRPRGETASADLQFFNELTNSIKERTENIMITDLVRNDLSKVAKKGTVKVPELCSVRSFHHVHQMISRVECELKEPPSFKRIINATFPMGSMTGAPKVRAMELADQYENGGRGMYSGAVGYLSSDGNMQMAVVIRSVLYDREKKYLTFSVGSAITAGAEAKSEYEECMTKARGIFEALGADIHTFAT